MRGQGPRAVTSMTSFDYSGKKNCSCQNFLFWATILSFPLPFSLTPCMFTQEETHPVQLAVLLLLYLVHYGPDCIIHYSQVCPGDCHGSSQVQLKYPGMQRQNLDLGLRYGERGGQIFLLTLFPWPKMALKRYFIFPGEQIAPWGHFRSRKMAWGSLGLPGLG